MTCSLISYQREIGKWDKTPQNLTAGRAVAKEEEDLPPVRFPEIGFGIGTDSTPTTGFSVVIIVLTSTG
jgi:hypothetical protein